MLIQASRTTTTSHELSGDVARSKHQDGEACEGVVLKLDALIEKGVKGMLIKAMFEPKT